MQRRFMFLGMWALAISACADGSPVTAPVELAASSATPAAVAEGAIVAHGQFSTPSGAGRRIVTLHAVQTPSGEVNGGYRVDITTNGLWFEVTASCVARGPQNGVWVAGHITAANSPLLVLGSVSYMYMHDNGEGDPSPDQASIARINDQLGRDEEFCTATPQLLPLLPGPMQGDIRLR